MAKNKTPNPALKVLSEIANQTTVITAELGGLGFQLENRPTLGKFTKAASNQNKNSPSRE